MSLIEEFYEAVASDNVYYDDESMTSGVWYSTSQRSWIRFAVSHDGIALL